MTRDANASPATQSLRHMPTGHVQTKTRDRHMSRSPTGIRFHVRVHIITRASCRHTRSGPLHDPMSYCVIYTSDSTRMCPRLLAASRVLLRRAHATVEMNTPPPEPLPAPPAPAPPAAPAAAAAAAAADSAPGPWPTPDVKLCVRAGMGRPCGSKIVHRHYNYDTV